jgi:L-ascorbate metabolism protein UlaG (beta-lactamase superfamily)
MFRKISLFFTLIFFSNIGFSQKTQIQIQFIGNCGLYLSDGNLNVYIDFPYKSGAHKYMEYDASEIDSIKENSIFIFTHKHSDHYSKSLTSTLTGEKYGPWNIPQLTAINDTVNSFSVEAFKTNHLFSLRHYSYLITWHGKKIFLSGDTKTTTTILDRKNMDWVFIPSWLVTQVNQTNKTIDTKHIGIYHIGPGDDVDIKGEKVLMLKKHGEKIFLSY